MCQTITDLTLIYKCIYLNFKHLNVLFACLFHCYFAVLFSYFYSSLLAWFIFHLVFINDKKTKKLNLIDLSVIAFNRLILMPCLIFSNHAFQSLCPCILMSRCVFYVSSVDFCDSNSSLTALLSLTEGYWLNLTIKLVISHTKKTIDYILHE